MYEFKLIGFNLFINASGRMEMTCSDSIHMNDFRNFCNEHDIEYTKQNPSSTSVYLHNEQDYLMCCLKFGKL